MKKITSPRFDFLFHVLSAASAVFLVFVLNSDEKKISVILVTLCLVLTSTVSCWQFYRKNRREIKTNSWESDIEENETKS
jgi:hypothetical protein